MSYTVEVAEPAERDADGIYDWIAERSPDGALRWWQAYRTALRKLQDDPTSYALAPEANLFDEPLHQLHFKTRRGHRYRAIFVVHGNVVHVLRVRGAGQNLLSSDDIDFPTWRCLQPLFMAAA